MKKTVVKFNAKALAKQIRDVIVPEQTRRLIEYAKEELNAMVESREFYNRTANAQDSYVWAVYYNGKRKGKGFYDPKTATTSSYLHEWSAERKERVNGRKAANAFLRSYQPSVSEGWEIVWCAAAPYLGYHEGGFHIGSKYFHFNVMSQRYDHIKNTLEPKCKVTFSVNPPKY